MISTTALCHHEAAHVVAEALDVAVTSVVIKPSIPRGDAFWRPTGIWRNCTILLAGTLSTRKKVREKYQLDAEDLVAKNWAQIERVAEVLMVRNKLSGDAVRALIRRVSRAR
jgi:hypothetical protein